MRLPLIVWLGGMLFFTFPASGQQFGLYLSSTFDEPSGDVYAYAETTADYSTGYYYDVCAGIGAYGQRDGYTLGQWDEYFQSHDMTCSSTDAEVNWWFSVPTDTVYLRVDGIHAEDMYYYVYQFDYYCWDDCYSSWDAFEFSFLGIPDGYDAGYGMLMYLPGLPGVGVVQSQFYQDTFNEHGTWCVYPYYETSVYSGKSTTGPSNEDGYFGLFYASFTPSTYLDYTGRYVYEDVDLNYEDCSALGTLFPPITNSNLDDSGYWEAQSESYGQDSPDFIGVSKEWGDYFQPLLEPDAACTMFAGTQAMYINSCRNPLVLHQYDAGHDLRFTLYQFGYAGSMISKRGGAWGDAQ